MITEQMSHGGSSGERISPCQIVDIGLRKRIAFSWRIEMMISKCSMILSTLLFVVVIFVSQTESKQSAKIETFVDKYILYSDLGLYQRADYKKGFFDDVLGVPSHKLSKLISDKCEIVYEKDGKEILLTKKEFIDGIEKARFTLKAKGIVIDGPQYSCGQDNKNTIVKMTKGLMAEKIIDVVECELTVKENDSSFLITAIKQRYRNPTGTEIQEMEAGLTHQPYNSRQGLGARYIGGGWFNSSVCFSSDGEKIVFVSLQYESSEICIMNRDGSAVKRLTNTPYWEINPSFTPDGKSILFVSDQDNNYEGEPYLLNIEDNSIEKFAPGYRSVRDVCYSSDANSVAFIATANNKDEIYFLDKKDGDIRKITQTGLEKYSLVFFPDGKKICFSQQWYDDGHPPRIVEMFSSTTNGSSLIQLTNSRVKKQPFAVTSDGIIVFLRQDENYKDEIWSMKSDGKDVKCLTRQEFQMDCVWEPQITPDKTRAVFVAWDKKTGRYHYQLFSLDLCNHFQIEQITHEKKNVSGYDISPDGKYIVVLLREDRGRGKGDIGIVPVVGGVVKIIGRNY